MANIVNAPEEGVASNVTTPDDTTPEEYRGKSVQEIIEMHQNATRKIGQMSEEVGSLRKIAEQSLNAPRETQASGTLDVDEGDFYSDPVTNIQRVVQQMIAPLVSKEEERRAETVKQKLNAEHPGWEDTVKSESFQKWVAASKVRRDLFQQADSADYDAADELLTTFNALENTKAEASSIERKAVDRDRKLRAATTETKGAAGIDSRKILSRSDLRTLRQTNPSRYNELLPDIRKAYAEGRVR